MKYPKGMKAYMGAQRLIWFEVVSINEEGEITLKVGKLPFTDARNTITVTDDELEKIREDE